MSDPARRGPGPAGPGRRGQQGQGPSQQGPSLPGREGPGRRGEISDRANGYGYGNGYLNLGTGYQVDLLIF
eukprot:SAG31_NODE_318_length_17799_cov_79.857571_8_plen_71_part_00